MTGAVVEVMVTLAADQILVATVLETVLVVMVVVATVLVATVRVASALAAMVLVAMGVGSLEEVTVGTVLDLSVVGLTVRGIVVATGQGMIRERWAAVADSLSHLHSTFHPEEGPGEEDQWEWVVAEIIRSCRSLSR